MVELLQLIQLSDRAVPIGGMAHSFGLEGLVNAGGVTPESIRDFVVTFLEEQGALEVCYCRSAYRASVRLEEASALCYALSAIKPARESREASIVLGRRLLDLVCSLVTAEQAVFLRGAFAGHQPGYLEASILWRQARDHPQRRVHRVEHHGGRQRVHPNAPASSL